MTRIPGPAICGLADVFVGAAPKTTVLVKPKGGTAPPPSTKKKTAAPPTGGKVPIRMMQGGTTKEGHGHAKAAAYNALKAGDKALSAAKQGAKSAKTYVKGVYVGAHSPLVPLQIAAVRPHDGTVVLGAAVSKPLTAAQKAAVSRHNQAIAKTAAAARRLAAVVQKAQAAGQAAHAVSKQVMGAVAQALKPKWPRGGHVGYVDDLYAALGLDPDGEPSVVMGDDPAAADPNAAPADPGAAAPADPSQAASPADPGTGAPDPGSGPVTAPDGTVLYDPATDPAVVPLPQRGQALSSDDAQIAWQHVPDDGIPYDGSHGLPENSIGSWNVFYGGSTQNALGFGVPGFLRGSADGGQTIQWLANTPEMGDQTFRLADPSFQSTATSGAPDAAAVSGNSLQRGWGPIIGNPGLGLAGLQYAIADKVWFWQGKNAPSWATAETDAKTAAANQKTIAANRAAALVQLAQMQKDQAAQQEAQAKQDAANALAQSAADTQAHIADQQAQAQQQQVDIEQQKAQADSASAEAQAQHALVTQADVWNKWAMAHPDEAVQQMQGDGGGDGEGGGGGEDNDGPRMVSEDEDDDTEDD